jgi:tRNA pseudouridine55 synthase
VAIPKGLEPTGIVLVDKPAGPTSFDLVAAVRRSTGAKTGHAGTLDPFATGLLVLLSGRATSQQDRFMKLDKRYLTEIDLTARTATGDPEGDVLETHDAPDNDTLAGALDALRGAVELPIPAASAVKIDGERAYRLHRKGVAVEMPMRVMRVHELELVSYVDGIAALDLNVGSGTYVRSIADALGGHCRTLRRTTVGPFSVEDADEDRVLTMREAVSHLPEVELARDEVGRVLSGVAVPRPGAGRVRLSYDGRLVAVAKLGGGLARPETVFTGIAE